MNNLSTTALTSTTTVVRTTKIITAVASAATTMFNNSNNGTNHYPAKLPPMALHCTNQVTNQQEKIIKMTAYSVILVVSLFGNILIAAVILSNKNLKKPNNYFILNMAISDLITPLMADSKELVQLYRESSFWFTGGTIGTLLCKLFHFSSNVTIAVSALSLILITVDRFIAVIFPMKHYIMSSRVCKVLILATWLMAMGTYAVNLYIFEVQSSSWVNVHACLAKWNKIDKELAASLPIKHYLATFSLLVAMPFVVMTAAYTIIIVSLKRQSMPLGESFSDSQRRQRVKREQKVVRLAIAVILTFVLSYFPFHVLTFMNIYANDYIMSRFCFVRIFRFIAVFCAYSNAALNPCVVFMFSQNFRHGFMQMLAKVGIVKTRNIRQQQPANQHEMQNMAYENDTVPQ